MEKLLTVNNLNLNFNTFKGKNKVLRNINIDVNKSEVLGIVGETGCGKSVLALSILGLVPKPGEITGGQIYFRQKNLLELSDKELENIRGKNISLIFQSPMSALNPVFKVKKQMMEVILAHSNKSKKEALKEALRLLNLVRVPEPESVLECYPHELSGGMAQRVVISMAISSQPALLIADEPTTALDVTIEKQIIRLMKNIKEELETSLIFISHDLEIIKQIAERVAVMYAGNIVEIGDCNDILNSPIHPYTKALIKAVPSRIKRGQELQGIEGIVPELIDLPEGCIFESRCEKSIAKCKEGSPPKLKNVSENRYVACFNFEG